MLDWSTPTSSRQRIDEHRGLVQCHIMVRAHRGLKTAFQFYASFEGSTSAFSTICF